MGHCENALVCVISCSKGVSSIDIAGREKKLRDRTLSTQYWPPPPSTLDLELQSTASKSTELSGDICPCTGSCQTQPWQLSRLSTHQISWHPGLPGSGLHFEGLHTGLSTHPDSSSWCSGYLPLLQLFHWPRQLLLWHSGLSLLCPLERKDKNLCDSQERGGNTLASQRGCEERSRENQPSYARTNLVPCPACPAQTGAGSGAAPSSHGGQPACPLLSAERLE